MEPFISQIFIMGCNFAPRGFALCDGQLLPISQNTALFSLVGTIYGGDGRTTMGLPDLRGRSPMHFGTGPGLQTVRQGQKFGSGTTTLQLPNLPAHNHQSRMKVGPGAATLDVADGNYLAHESRGGDDVPQIYTNTIGSAPQSMAAGAIEVGMTGANQSFNNFHPVQVVNFCIALVGIFPSRN